MKKRNCLPEENEKGFVFIVCILLLFVLTIAGIATVRTSGTELWTVRNQGQIIRELYAAETGLLDALENPWWLEDDDFFLADPNDAVSPSALNISLTVDPHISDKIPAWETEFDGRDYAWYRIRCVQIGTIAPGLWDSEDDGPTTIAHVGAPPVGSGDSAAEFSVRRFVITARSRTGNTSVQGGVWKSFPALPDE